MKIFYGNEVMELTNSVSPAAALEIVRGMGNTQYTEFERLNTGDVMLKVKSATKG